MPKSWLCVFVGDMHVLSSTGLCLPGHPIASNDGATYTGSPRQRELYGYWQDFTEKVRHLSTLYHVALMFGGDGIDGPGHHGTTRTTGNRADAVEMAVELLRPINNVAVERFGLTGTAAHVDEGGEQDRSIARELGIECRDVWEITIGGRNLLWAHECIKVGRYEHTIDSHMIATARDYAMKCAADPSLTRPDLIVGHHVHRSPRPVTVRDITVATVGCWQYPTAWAVSKFPFTKVDIGAMFWKPSTMQLHRQIYKSAQTRRVVAIPAYTTPKRAPGEGVPVVHGNEQQAP